MNAKRSAESANIVHSALRVEADLLIPGRGHPVENATLVCGTEKSERTDDKGKILYVGPTANLPAKFSDLSATKVPVLMPGLWDWCVISWDGVL